MLDVARIDQDGGPRQQTDHVGGSGSGQHPVGQVGLDQDRQLPGELRPGVDGGRQTRRLDDVDCGFPSGRERQPDPDLDIVVEVANRCHHPPGVTGQVVEVAEGGVSSDQPETRDAPVHDYEPAGAAGDDRRHVEHLVCRTRAASDPRQLGVGNHERAEQGRVGLLAMLDDAGDHLGRISTQHTPQQSGVVEKAAPEVHVWQGNGMVSYSAAQAERALQLVRSACLGLPEVSERPSHGGPAFFVRDKRCLVMFLDDHHGDGRLAIWCAAPDGVQAEMVATEPDRFFVPPYVGHRGWLGVHLVDIEPAELDAICRDAFCVVAPATVRRRLSSA